MSRECRTLSRILRHSPQEAGLTLGPGGWVRVDDLLKGLRSLGLRLRREDIERIVAENDKSRFTLSEDVQRIRAAQGHSVAVDLQLAPAVPPPVLYHGTARSSLEAILVQGLKPGRRQHVHLSQDLETVARVGARHGKPVVLRVDTAALYAEGQLFWHTDNGVWLTDAVPPHHLAVEAWD
jgi:putative RNA 2'-phosphotransferase